MQNQSSKDIQEKNENGATYLENLAQSIPIDDSFLSIALEKHYFIDILPYLSDGLWSDAAGIFFKTYLQIPEIYPRMNSFAVLCCIHGVDFQKLLRSPNLIHPSKFDVCLIAFQPLLAEISLLTEFENLDQADSRFYKFFCERSKSVTKNPTLVSIAFLLKSKIDQLMKDTIHVKDIVSPEFFSPTERQQLCQVNNAFNATLTADNELPLNSFSQAILQHLENLSKFFESVNPRFIGLQRRLVAPKVLLSQIQEIEKFKTIVFNSILKNFDNQTAKTWILHKVCDDIDVYQAIILAGVCICIKNKSQEYLEKFLIETRCLGTILNSSCTINDPLPIDPAAPNTSRNLIETSINYCLNSIHFAECKYLEAQVSLDTVVGCQLIPAYPSKTASIYERYVLASALLTKCIDNCDQCQDFLVTISEKVTNLFRNYLKIPGIPKTLSWKNYKPLINHNWAQIPHVKWPQTAEEVRTIANMKSKLQDQLSKLEQAEHVANCCNCFNSPAKYVCPDCKKLVLCERCYDDLGECPECYKTLA